MGIFKRSGIIFDDESEQDSEQANENTGLLSSRAEPIQTIAGLLKRTELHKPLAAAFGLQIAQQCSGINAAIYYSTSIFRSSYSSETAIKFTVLISIVNLIMTLISMSLIEKLGRRTLLLSAELTMGFSALLVAVLAQLNALPILIVISLLIFVAGFGLGMGSVPWLILPELVPGYALGVSVSICTSLNWTTNFILALIMPILIRESKLLKLTHCNSRV